jgi:hypothetical protein
MVLAQEKFTVVAYDLNTNTRLCELPANSLLFDTRLNDAGSISFDIPLQSPGVSKMVKPILSYDGNPFAVYVDRNGVIVWGGIAWTGLYTRSTGLLEVGGKEFLAYFDQRLAAADYSVTTYPNGIDPAQLLYKAFTDAQSTILSGAGASIGLNVSVKSTGLPMITPGYPSSQHSMVTDIVDDIIATNVFGVGGVDLQFALGYNAAGLPTRSLSLVTPRAGRTAGSTGLMFDLSQSIDYTWPTDATQSGNTLVFTGAGSGDAIPTSTVHAPNVPVGGLGQAPRLDKVVSTSAQSQDQVTLMANGTAQQYGAPLVTPTVTVQTGGRQPLGSWIMGDDARLYLPPGDDRFPDGLDQFWRIVQSATTVPDAGVAQAELTFNVPPIF